jgi:DNA-binding transcriptional regulator PaaX
MTYIVLRDTLNNAYLVARTNEAVKTVVATCWNLADAARIAQLLEQYESKNSQTAAPSHSPRRPD